MHNTCFVPARNCLRNVSHSNSKVEEKCGLNVSTIRPANIYSLLAFKNERLMILPCCLSVWPPPQLITFEPNYRFSWKTVTPVSSTLTKWQTFKLLRWMQNLHETTRDREGLSLVTSVTTPISCKQLKPRLCSKGSHSWTHCLTTVTMETKERITRNLTKLRSLRYLNNVNNTVLLNHVRVVAEIVVLSRIYCYNIVSLCRYIKQIIATS
jgi:hypothetical protein